MFRKEVQDLATWMAAFRTDSPHYVTMLALAELFLSEPLFRHPSDEEVEAGRSPYDMVKING